jgi:beta-glucanase (GH16 family)
MQRIHYYTLISIVAAIGWLGCAVQKKTVSTVLIDKQTPTDAIPFINNDSVSKESLQRNWRLDFSDEFNDNTIDTNKWNVETSIKKRVDVTLYADKDQVEEKDGNMYIYYRKSNISDTAYNAGRFTSRGKYAPTYGFLRM